MFRRHPLTSEEQFINTLIDASLPAGPAAASQARRMLAEVRADLPEELYEDLRLLVSELVTNSIRHTGAHGPADSVRLRLLMDADLVRVEVLDNGAGFKKAVTPVTPEQQSGWGLQIVDHLTSRWGVDPAEGSGSTVWFEIDL